MEFITLIESVGFNLALIIGLCYYVAKMQKENREDWQRREDNFLATLAEQTDVNKKLLETNATLTYGIIPRLENIEEKLENL